MTYACPREPRPVPQVPPEHVRRGHRPGARHRSAAAGAPQRQGQPRLPVLRPARLRQDVQRPHPGPLAQLRAGPDARPVRGVRLLRRAGAATAPGSLDVIEIDAASHGGVDDARDLRERAFYAPVSSTFKIYIIDEAHMVTPGGLQRPAQAGRGAAGAPEVHLRDDRAGEGHRHHPLAHPPLPVPAGAAARAARDLVQNICAQEDVEVDPLVLPLVVRAGAGSAPRRAVGARPAAGGGWARGPDLRARGRAARLHRRCACSTRWSTRSPPATAPRSSRSSTGWSRAATTRAGSPPTCSSGCATCSSSRPCPDAAAKGLLDAPQDQLERMGVQAGRLGSAELSRAADIVNAGLVEMRGATAPRLHARADLRPGAAAGRRQGRGVDAGPARPARAPARGRGCTRTGRPAGDRGRPARSPDRHADGDASAVATPEPARLARPTPSRPPATPSTRPAPQPAPPRTSRRRPGTTRRMAGPVSRGPSPPLSTSR